MKKVFFVYSDDSEDVGLYKELKQHFTAYAKKGFLHIIDKDELFRSGGDRTKALELAGSSDITIPLISVDYINNEECLKMLEAAAASHKSVIPVLLRDCEWDEVDKLRAYSGEILPDGQSSVIALISKEKSEDAVFSNIARRIKAVVFNNELKDMPLSGIRKENKTFYYILSTVVMLIGVLVAAISYSWWTDWKISVVLFLLFGVVALMALKNVLFPARFTTG